MNLVTMREKKTDLNLILSNIRIHVNTITKIKKVMGKI